MVTVTFERFDSYNSGRLDDRRELEMSAAAAFQTMVEFDLAFGASLTEAASTKLILRSQVMNKIDITTYTGPAQEMEPLHRLVGTYFEKPTLGVPPVDVSEYVIWAASHIWYIVAALLSLGIKPDLELLNGYRRQDIIAAATLELETGTPIREVLQALSG